MSLQCTNSFGYYVKERTSVKALVVTGERRKFRRRPTLSLAPDPVAILYRRNKAETKSDLRVRNTRVVVKHEYPVVCATYGDPSFLDTVRVSDPCGGDVHEYKKPG